MRTIDEDLKAAIAVANLEPAAVEQLERAARALASMPRWMASSITSTRRVEDGQMPAFREVASYLARRHGLYVTVSDSSPASACFFRRDTER